MGYEKRYDMDTMAGRDAACQDFEDWIGPARIKILLDGIAAEQIVDMAGLELFASFMGIHGAPVRAWGERHGLY